jgi:hypothetical protein
VVAFLSGGWGWPLPAEAEPCNTINCPPPHHHHQNQFVIYSTDINQPSKDVPPLFTLCLIDYSVACPEQQGHP